MGKSVSSVSSTICVASFWTEPCFRKSYESYENLRKYHRIPYMEHVGIVASRCLDVWMLGFYLRPLEPFILHNVQVYPHKLHAIIYWFPDTCVEEICIPAV